MVNEPAQPESHEDDDGGLGFLKWMFIFAGGVAALIAGIFLIGFVISLASPSDITATRIRMIRDVFIILLALEFILIVLALVVLILQITRLIAMLRDEIKPIMTDARDTVDTAKGTAQFVGQNVARPVIGVSAFMAGLWAFLREIGGIRRAVRKEPQRGEESNDDGS